MFLRRHFQNCLKSQPHLQNHQKRHLLERRHYYHHHPRRLRLLRRTRNYRHWFQNYLVLMRRHRWPALQLHQDGSRYFDVHHTDRDTIEQVDPAALRQNVACWAACTWLAAQSPLPFGPPPL